MANQTNQFPLTIWFGFKPISFLRLSFLNSIGILSIALQVDNPAKVHDPFFETQENHNLIGVANVFLESLFHDVTLDYHTPIISQQGEVAGRLQVNKNCQYLIALFIFETVYSF